MLGGEYLFAFELVVYSDYLHYIEMRLLADRRPMEIELYIAKPKTPFRLAWPAGRE